MINYEDNTKFPRNNYILFDGIPIDTTRSRIVSSSMVKISHTLDNLSLSPTLEESYEAKVEGITIGKRQNFITTRKRVNIWGVKKCLVRATILVIIQHIIHSEVDSNLNKRNNASDRMTKYNRISYIIFVSTQFVTR